MQELRFLAFDSVQGTQTGAMQSTYIHLCLSQVPGFIWTHGVCTQRREVSTVHTQVTRQLTANETHTVTAVPPFPEGFNKEGGARASLKPCHKFLIGLLKRSRMSQLEFARSSSIRCNTIYTNTL